MVLSSLNGRNQHPPKHSELHRVHKVVYMRMYPIIQKGFLTCQDDAANNDGQSSSGPVKDEKFINSTPE